MHYDDIHPEEELARLEFADVSPADMKLVSAIMGDPNPIHYDRSVTDEMGYPGLVNQGPINMSYLTQAALAVARSPTDIRSMAYRLEDNVFEGEDVVATARATRTYVEDGCGFADLALVLETSDGKTVVTGEATVRVGLD